MLKLEKDKNKTEFHYSLLFPTLWNNFFHPQADLSKQIGSSDHLASRPQKSIS